MRCAKAAAQSMEAVKKDEEARVVALRAVEATPESFAPFGQVIAATPDGDEFGPHDAQLDLTRGIPRSGCTTPNLLAVPRTRNTRVARAHVTRRAVMRWLVGGTG